jgi:UDP-N-acetylglucosamine--N-acetylmuramyl-(pentapeptide) pyrophosphoryl-undecaprenol N-acetylglucosamine transferase
MKYLLTGGGTGGHVYPALAIADEIKRRQPDAEFLYVGRRDKLEAWVVPEREYPIRFVRARAFPRSKSIGALLSFVLALFCGMVQSALILLRFRPHVIIGTGGYVSAPILFAHGLLSKIALSRSRVFLYEPNAHPGMLNQVAGRLAHRVGIAFEQAGRWFDMKRIAVVGYPVRSEFLVLDKKDARQQLDIADNEQVVLVFGGSGGAKVINEALVEALPKLADRSGLTIVHITGRYAGTDYDAVRDTRHAVDKLQLADKALHYRAVEYMGDIHLAYAAADLVVCRGGAGTLTELGVAGKPALIVPLATAAEDHQAANAREMERMGAARVLYQQARWQDGQIHSVLDGGDLAQRLLELLDDGEKLRQMALAAAAVPRRDSLSLIMEEIENISTERRGAALNLEYPMRPSGPPAEANALMRWVQAQVHSAGGIESLEPCDVAYMRYQADRLLVSRAWCEIPLGRRNVGIKLIGLLCYEKQRSLLLHILLDRSPVSWLQRAFGGDFYHGGILRRNVVEWGIRLLGAADAPTRSALEAALVEDPYFEVRSASARVLGEHGQPNKRTESVLMEALEDASPAVVVEALKALGNLATGADFLPALRRFYLHPNWQYRQGVVQALAMGVDRGVLAAEDVAGELDEIIASSPFFKPTFALNESLRLLALRLEEGRKGSSTDLRVL